MKLEQKIQISRPAAASVVGCKLNNEDMIKHFTIMLSLVILPTIVFAQKRVTVKDPEIEFSFIKPNGWKTHDDEYNYYVYSPAVRDALVSITYYEADSDKKVDEYFDFALEYMYPNNEPGFKLLETGDDTVDGVPAKWAKYQSSGQGIDHLSILYMFVKDGQRFTFLGSARKIDFDKMFDDFVKIIRSTKSQKI